MAEMEIDTHDDILRKVALDGSMDYSSWPELLPDVLERIEKIANTVFPIPHIPPPRAARARPTPPPLTGPPPSSGTTVAADSSQDTNKENASPTPATTATAPSSSSSTTAVAPPSSCPEGSTLPKPVQAMLDEILSVLRSNFSSNPPHTIQRLSELILHPRKHYKSCIAWLHALDRVVHVTSGANIYPLPPAIPDMSSISLTSTTSSTTPTVHSTVGTDEALGGALLTPIPWLARRTNGGGGSDSGSDDDGGSSPLSASGISSGPVLQQQQQQPQQQHFHLQRQQHSSPSVRTESTETIEGPNGMGRIETVSISVNGIPSTGASSSNAVLAQRGITQGELLRQEQRAGVVPMSQLARQQHVAQARASAKEKEEDATMTSKEEEDEEETPHARGPEEIGAADTGPQPPGSAQTYTVGIAGNAVETRGINVEAAVGRPPDQTDAVSAAIAASAAGVTGTGDQQQQDIIPRSPKREAPDELSGGAAKRVKEGGGGEMEVDQAEGSVPTAPVTEQDKPAEEGPAAEKEGDKSEKKKPEEEAATAAGKEGDEKEEAEKKTSDA
ncbi:hypothetical protein QBC35DRAFT_486171 [Podospora australis]|uniref:Uncharacterized protein n=1 Tax=Podospora australis TaxID=1536484 RepID=A0AAN6X0X8_9PEZI|nr:hypothetical protein QBC35DRAFT_486171 [Podospora australis]